MNPGAYRYTFNVDGVETIDPHNPSTSESNANTWSLVYVPGAAFMDAQDVPHGSVAAVPYVSKVLKAERRLHVYTPPGYETSNQKYPVFYLLHGAGDCDDSWSSVGRAGYILDNLIASKKAKPMIVVMPAGHTTRANSGLQLPTQAASGAALFEDDFSHEFEADIKPIIESRYRVLSGRQNRAIAGLSMGGNHALMIAIPHLDEYAYVGVFSSGLLNTFGVGGGPEPRDRTAAWEATYKDRLDNSALKKGLKVMWFSTGSDDFLLGTTKTSVELLKKHAFNAQFDQSTGGHTWINWRNYLNEFAPRLFQ